MERLNYLFTYLSVSDWLKKYVSRLFLIYTLYAFYGCR